MIGQPNNKPLVGIIGLGHVGSSLASALAPAAGLVCFDRRLHDAYPATDLARCDVVAVCVDTPPAADGSCDTTNVWDAVTRLPNDRVWLRSTVAPGTTDALIERTGKQICMSPEYYGEHAHAPLAFAAAPQEVPFFVVGGRPDHRAALLDLLVPLFGADRLYFQCTSREAELIKYMENAFLAMKVAFVNEFARICDGQEADWHTVREGWLLDPRVGRSHSAVYGPTGGFGGPCLPKDLDAIIDAARRSGYDPSLLDAVRAANARHRATPVVALEG